MNRQQALLSLSSVVLACSAVACSSKSTGEAASSPSGSEVAVSVVSGALNNNSGTGVSLFAPRAPKLNKRSLLERGLAALNPIGTASAAEWSCSGDGLTPKFAGPGSYSWAPASCKVTWLGGRTASSIWSGPFSLDYGSSCDDASALMETQVGGCEMTRTSAVGGTTRTITGPDGNSYAIDHDTNGAGTGWDSSVSPAPSDGGVQVSCGTGGCSSSRTLVISGSHLTGTVDIDGDTTKIWDHTVSTGSEGLSVTGSGASRVVNGSVTVQHNLIQVTSTTTFSSVEYAEPLCCFPTAGSVSTTFSKGSDVGKTESIAFTGVCGEATLTKPDGSSVALTFAHCL